MVDKSLVRQVEQADGEPRLHMLETIREYGLEKLAASAEETLACKAHAAYYVVLAEDAAREKSPSEITTWMDRFETEHDNFRAALDWLIEAKNAEWGVRLATALFRFWETREYFTEGRHWLGGCRRKIFSNVKSIGYGQSQACKSLILRRRFVLSDSLLEAVLKLPSTPGQDTVRMRALFAAGVLARNQHDYDASERLLGENLEIARRLQDQQSVAVSLNRAWAQDKGLTFSFY